MAAFTPSIRVTAGTPPSSSVPLERTMTSPFPLEPAGRGVRDGAGVFGVGVIRVATAGAGGRPRSAPNLPVIHSSRINAASRPAATIAVRTAGGDERQIDPTV